MSRKLIAMIGVPGSGKSTVMKEFMYEWEWSKDRYKLLDYHRSGDVFVLGKYEEGEVFCGTDRLAMNVMPDAIEFLEETKEGVVVFEGDRLSSSKYFKEAQRIGWELSIYHIIASESERERRYKERGSDQSAKFIESRVTKVDNIVEEFGDNQTLFGEEKGCVIPMFNNNEPDVDRISQAIHEEINDHFLAGALEDL